MVVLSLLLASLLLVEKPARAQAGWEWGIPIVNMPASWWTYMGATASGATIWASPLGVASGGGSATITGAGTAGVVAQGGTAMAVGSAAVAGGVGIALGWGAYEAGLWSWLGCENVLNTGSSACEGGDPVPGTQSGVGVLYSGRWDVNPTPSIDDSGSNDYYFEPTNDRPLAYAIRGQSRTYGDQTSALGTSSYNLGYISTTWGTDQGAGRFSLCTAGTTVTDCDAADVGDPVLEYRWTADAEIAGEGGSVEKDRRIAVNVECTDYGDPAEPTMTDTVTTPWYAPGQEVDIPGGSCPDGWTLTDYEAVREVDGDAAAEEVLFSHPGPSGLSSSDPEAECYDGSCEVMIHRVIDGQPQACDSEHVNCLGWMDAYDVDPTEWQCLWGGVHVLPISDCEPYEKIDEGTYTGPTVEDEAGSAPTTDTPPGTSSDPIHVEEGCGGGSWLNPFDNIAAGFACVMEWAFIPTSDQMADIQSDIEASTSAIEGKAGFAELKQMDQWASGMPADLPADAPGCWEARFDISMLPGDQNSLVAIDTCPADPVVTWLHANRGMLEGFLYGVMIVPMLWWAWRQSMPIIGGSGQP